MLAVPMRRRRLCALVGAVLLLAMVQAPAYGAEALPEDAVRIIPTDPLFEYTEYVHATIGPDRARFDRPGVFSAFVDVSPGTRVNFVADATEVSMVVDYRRKGRCEGCGKFWVEVDGVLQPDGIGSDSTLGEQTFLVQAQPTPVPHTFSLIYPYRVPVDFLGLDLVGGSEALTGEPPARPDFLYVAFGDSVTMGEASTGIVRTYPDQVARVKGWSVINEGFNLEATDPGDGVAVGSLGADLITTATGFNDFRKSKGLLRFAEDYNLLLDDIRAQQPDVPIYCITPTVTWFENVSNRHGDILEDYRDTIRSVVSDRTATDPNLFLIEGTPLVSPENLKDGVHPNDAGYEQYAMNLAAALP